MEGKNYEKKHLKMVGKTKKNKTIGKRKIETTGIKNASIFFQKQ